MSNEVERADRSIRFAKKALDYYKEQKEKYNAINDDFIFISSVSQVFLDSECADCAQSPAGRLYNDTRIKGSYTI